jgi:hypothetical protein
VHAEADTQHDNTTKRPANPVAESAAAIKDRATSAHPMPLKSVKTRTAQHKKVLCTGSDASAICAHVNAATAAFVGAIGMTFAELDKLRKPCSIKAALRVRVRAF